MEWSRIKCKVQSTDILCSGTFHHLMQKKRKQQYNTYTLIIMLSWFAQKLATSKTEFVVYLSSKNRSDGGGVLLAELQPVALL